jgi:putative colanic acid biosysnthesis UDP-glucose lipid carrier transferase
MQQGIAVKFDRQDRLLPRTQDGRAAGSRGRAERPIARRARAANGAALKRTVDLTVALTALLFLIPLFLAVALLIKAESQGPVLFRQKRYGLNRQPFEILKFRTMTVLEASGGFEQASANDRRVTRIGRFLRRSSLDEMPQLLNVVLGQMSLVGPRPHAIAMDDTYADMVSDYDDRFLVRPGLTGLAQITGYRGPTDTYDKIARRIGRDRVYIRRWSLGLDVMIVLQTPIRLVKDPNAL